MIRRGYISGVRYQVSGARGQGPGTRIPSSPQDHIGEDEAVALDDIAHVGIYRLSEHRPIPHEGVKLAVLAARIDTSRQVGQQRSVEGTTRERAVKLPWV